MMKAGGAEPKKQENYGVTLDRREQAVVTGVQDVVRFDEEVVILKTVGGELTLTGGGLHMASLQLNEGKLVVQGKVDSFAYSDHKAREGGFFSRLFR